MTSWDIAKYLIQSCNSPEEVSHVVATLQNPQEVERVCDILTSFSVTTPTKQSHRGSKEKPGPLALNGASAKRRSVNKTGGTKTDSTGEAIAVKLEPLFRDQGMTNQQVEEWVASNFSIVEAIGKRSLRKYLIRVLDSADLGLKNRIMAAAQQLGNDPGAEDSDLVKYWDGFDKHFGASE